MAHLEGLTRAGLTYALRNGWTEAERTDLTDAISVVLELLGAYYGGIPDDLRATYAHEYEAAEARIEDLADVGI